MRGLVDPDAVSEALRDYHARYAERQKREKVDVPGLRRDVARNQVEINRLVKAITDIGPQKELTAKLKALDLERGDLADRLRQAEAESNVVELHPKAVETYKTEIGNLYAYLVDPKYSPLEKRAQLRKLIDHIVVYRTEPRQPYEFTPVASGLGEILGLEPTVGKTGGNAKVRVLRSRQDGVARLGQLDMAEVG